MFDSLVSSAINPTPELNANNTRKLISHSEIQKAIKDLADIVNAEYVQILKKSEYDKCTAEVVVLCVMNGGMVFCANLLPLLNFPLQFDTLQVSRYGDKDKGGVLAWLKKPELDLRNKHVLIVDDLIDEGVSITDVFNFCQGENSASTKVAVLLSKDTSRRKPEAVNPNYIGLTIPDEFIFGFGIDYKNYYRNLLDIYSIKP